MLERIIQQEAQIGGVEEDDMRAKRKNLQHRKRRLRVPQKPLFEWREGGGGKQKRQKREKRNRH